VDLYRA